MENELLALKPLVGLVFVLVYIALVIFKHKRPQVVWSGIAVMFVTLVMYGFWGKGLLQGVWVVAWEFFRSISWNVLGIFSGTLLIATIFIESKVPLWLADWLIQRTKTIGIALLGICALSSLISAFVDNVATVLIVAPVAIAISRRLEISPVPALIGLAISSNLQGTATLVGDPPSMITAGFLSQRWPEHLFSFNEFFIFQGKPSLFFIVQIGAICAFGVLYFFFRKYNQPTIAPEMVTIESMVPTYILVGIIPGLAVSTRFDPNFTYFGGMVCLTGAVIALIWKYIHEGSRGYQILSHRRGRQAALQILKRYDLETALFLAGIFILVALVEKSGIITDIAGILQNLFGDNLFLTFTVLVWLSVLFSAVIDNIPYIMVMLPVTAQLGERLGGPGSSACYVLSFGLLVGACLGGNCTPIGASANVVSIGLLKKEGYTVGFGEFMKIGIPFTLAATLAGYVCIWLIWR